MTFINRRKMLLTSALLSAASFAGLSLGYPKRANADTPPLSPEEITAIEDAIGKRGSYSREESTLTITLPRNDLGRITIKGETVPAAFASEGWVSVKKTMDGKDSVLRSATVLMEEEVNPFISSALGNGLEIGGIYNHLFYDKPRLFQVHLQGNGRVEELSNKYSNTLKATNIHPLMQPEISEPIPTAKEIFDLAALDSIVKARGHVNGQVYSYSIGRDDVTVMAMGAKISPWMGLNSLVQFSGTNEKAQIAGRVVALEHEVNSLIRTLRLHNLEVVGVHNHMLAERPRMSFLNFYGGGNPSSLAKGFRAAIDVLGKR